MPSRLSVSSAALSWMLPLLLLLLLEAAEESDAYAELGELAVAQKAGEPTEEEA